MENRALRIPSITIFSRMSVDSEGTGCSEVIADVAESPLGAASLPAEEEVVGLKVPLDSHFGRSRSRIRAHSLRFTSKVLIMSAMSWRRRKP